MRVVREVAWGAPRAGVCSGRRRRAARPNMWGGGLGARRQPALREESAPTLADRHPRHAFEHQLAVGDERDEGHGHLRYAGRYTGQYASMPRCFLNTGKAAPPRLGRMSTPPCQLASGVPCLGWSWKAGGVKAEAASTQLQHPAAAPSCSALCSARMQHPGSTHHPSAGPAQHPHQTCL